mgnify:FL=1
MIFKEVTDLTLSGGYNSLKTQTNIAAGNLYLSLDTFKNFFTDTRTNVKSFIQGTDENIRLYLGNATTGSGPLGISSMDEQYIIPSTDAGRILNSSGQLVGQITNTRDRTDNGIIVTDKIIVKPCYALMASSFSMGGEYNVISSPNGKAITDMMGLLISNNPALSQITYTIYDNTYGIEDATFINNEITYFSDLVLFKNKLVRTIPI